MTDQHNAKSKLAELLDSIGHNNKEITEYKTEAVNPARTTLVGNRPRG